MLLHSIVSDVLLLLQYEPHECINYERRACEILNKLLKSLLSDRTSIWFKMQCLHLPHSLHTMEFAALF